MEKDAVVHLRLCEKDRGLHHLGFSAEISETGRVTKANLKKKIQDVITA